MLDKNVDVNPSHTSKINLECTLNIQIKEFILPRLPKAVETGFKHKSVAQNCYSDYDVSELSFDGV